MKCSNCGTEISDKMSEGLFEVTYCSNCSKKDSDKFLIMRESIFVEGLATTKIIVKKWKAGVMFDAEMSLRRDEIEGLIEKLTKVIGYENY